MKYLKIMNSYNGSFVYFDFQTKNPFGIIKTNNKFRGKKSEFVDSKFVVQCHELVPGHILLSKHNGKPLIVNNVLPFCCDNTSGLLVQFFIIPPKIIKFSFND